MKQYWVFFNNPKIYLQEFFVSINGSIDFKIFTREKSDIVKPVTGEITFTSKPGNQNARMLFIQNTLCIT